MFNTLPETPIHLDETPPSTAIFQAITASSAREIKALITTLEAGLRLIDDPEYTFICLPYSTARYTVATPGGDMHSIWFDPSRRVASCSCEACIRLGSCKHLVALHLQKAVIDQECTARVARIEAQLSGRDRGRETSQEISEQCIQ